jgi:hypothetical protein
MSGIKNNERMNRFTKTVILTGLFVGTTDILYAFMSGYIRSGNFPEKMFHYIAGGALGLEQSMKGGNGIAFLGLFFHYFIALAHTLFFFLVFPRLKFLKFDKYLVGMLYGVYVNLFMKFIVLPLTPLPGNAFVLSWVFIDWILFGLVFGVPVVYSAYKYYGEQSPNELN